MAKKKKPRRHAHTYRCLDDVQDALTDYMASLEYEPAANEIIDRAMRAFLREKGYTDLPEREPREDK